MREILPINQAAEPSYRICVSKWAELGRSNLPQSLPDLLSQVACEATCFGPVEQRLAMPGDTAVTQTVRYCPHIEAPAMPIEPKPLTKYGPKKWRLA